MSVSNELPEKCQECAKSVGPIIYDKCNFCRNDRLSLYIALTGVKFQEIAPLRSQ